MLYDDLLLLCLQARQRELLQEAQHDALAQRLRAGAPRQYARGLLWLSQALIGCGHKLQALAQARLARPAPVLVRTTRGGRRR